MDKKRKHIVWAMIVVWWALVIGVVIVSIGDAQITPGTVNSKTLDGVGNKITSTVSGPSRGIDVNCIGGSCGGAGVTYLDADGIANQTASAVHGQTYMYNGVTWDRVRGTIAGGLQVNCVTGCAGGASTPTDAFANPVTAGLSQSFGMVYNGATWDRMRGTIAGGVLTNISNASLAVTGTFFQATQPVSGTVAVSNAFLLDATFTGRFAAAYVDGDAIANQTTTAMHGQMYGYNGVTWDRLRSTIAGGLLVNMSNATIAVTQSGAWTVTANAGTNLNTSALALDATLTNRFPAGSTPANAESNAVTITRIGNYNYIFNGVTWDRWTGAVSQSGTWNIGTVTAVTSITNPVAVTGTFFQATQPVSIAATVTVQGAKTNNNAAPGATNVGVLPCVATAVAPSNTEGNQTGCSTNLLGATRVINESSVTTANNDGSCASGAVSFTAIASNASRTWLAVWASPANTDDVYLKLGAVATNADARFAPGQPLNFTSGRIYTGIIDAFPNSGTQAVCVMELN